MTGPRSMRAVRLVRAHGSVTPRVVEVPVPEPPAGSQVLVRVAASSVNGTELGLLRGGRLFRALSAGRAAPGFDLAGQVVACGPAVTGSRWATGSPLDRVVALEDVASALEHAGSGQLRGKVVVSVAARP